MESKEYINKIFYSSYSKILKNILESPRFFKHLHRINHKTYPLLDFDNLPEENKFKEREIIFHYPIPIFLTIITGDIFEIKVREITYINKNTCNIQGKIHIDTILGSIDLVENADYINNGISTQIIIKLSYKTKIPDIIIKKIIDNWLKDRNKYLDEVAK